MKKRETLPRDQWLQNLERVMFQKEPGLEADLNGDWDIEIVMRVAGGSLAVGVIDRVVSVKELIDTIISEAEAMLGKKGRLGRLVRKDE